MFRHITLLAAILLSLNSVKAVRGAEHEKKLIEFGWDEPDTAFMLKHIDQMERTPFDGCVFHARTVGLDGKPGNFLWECWGKRAFDQRELEPAIEDLKATPFKHFSENFLRFNVVPGDVDWFDDFGPILNNAKLAAKVAHDGKCRGVLFDIEQYNHLLFSYRKQRDAGSKSWDEYAKQARLRGRETMAAFQQGYPGLTVFLTFGFSLPYRQTKGDPSKLPDASYGLLAPFLDGMLDAAEGDSRIVDGFESSYGYKEISRFDAAREMMKAGVLNLVSDREKYVKVFSAGFGAWIDNDWRKAGWNTEDVSKNFYTPQAFERTVRKALQTSDQYVWIYTEQPKWWSEEGKPVKLPAEYESALRRAAGR